MGMLKIQGELLKLGISLDKKTTRNIIDKYRRRVKIKKSWSWKQSLSTKANSIYAMDFFTVNTLLDDRYNGFIIIHHMTREIVQFTITQSRCREFVRQQMITFSGHPNSTTYLTRDNAQQFKSDYLQYSTKPICTTVNVTNMNGIAERFIKSVRREAFDISTYPFMKDKFGAF